VYIKKTAGFQKKLQSQKEKNNVRTGPASYFDDVLFGQDVTEHNPPATALRPTAPERGVRHQIFTPHATK